MNSLDFIKRKVRKLSSRAPLLNARHRGMRETVRASSLFDDDWYLASYEDVSRAGVDPLDHYLAEGWLEGRNPNRLFDTRWYLSTYDDVHQNGVNPLLHYIQHGSVEGRDAGPGFRPSLAGPRGLLKGAHHFAVALKYVDGIARERDCLAHMPSSFHVLIVAELSIPQCRKYRVDQKQKLFRLLGIDATIVNWHDVKHFDSVLSMYSAVIFYRVPGAPYILELINKAHVRGLPTFWEVDDLIFDPNPYIENSNLETLDKEILRSVLTGVPIYRIGMLACDRAIASTPPLAEAMRRAGVRDVSVVENALDDDTVMWAQKAVASRMPATGSITIGYGSGTKTHDNDFLEATPALVLCLAAYPNLRLKIVGELKLSDVLLPYVNQIDLVPATSYGAYLKILANCDIAIAPLEPSIFNDAKSNIKYIEASMVELPSVCSDIAAFREIVEHGVNGLIADGPEGWRTALVSLIESADRRRALALAAKATVLARYSPARVATQQLAPVFKMASAHAAVTKTTRLRILVVNVFFHPQSFGGATVIAEQMARRLHSRDDVEVMVFTSAPPGLAPAYDIIEYSAWSMPVFAVVMPESQDIFAEFEDPFIADKFRDVLRTTRPDVVHIHCIQGFSADMLNICEEEGVRAVVTAHDAWWICQRQFMVTGNDRYCFQRRIDLNICSACVSEPGVNAYRQYRLRKALNKASLILTPSEFFRNLYIDNDFAPERLVVNKNGVRAAGHVIRVDSARLRFGFVGGNSKIKGAHLIRDAFSSILDEDYELVLVDNTLSLGYKSIEVQDWPIRGLLTILPSFTQENMDSFYSRIDVLLFPTQWKESFGLTVREALIRNIWVIVTDAGGVVEDVVDGINGTIIPLSGAPDALSAAITAALERREALKNHVNPNRASVVTYDEQAAELYSLLSGVANTVTDALGGDGWRS